jgi:hypothetical protein
VPEEKGSEGQLEVRVNCECREAGKKKRQEEGLGRPRNPEEFPIAWTSEYILH